MKAIEWAVSQSVTKSKYYTLVCEFTDLKYYLKTLKEHMYKVYKMKE